MKIKLILLILLFLFICPLESLSTPAKWARPQYIKTYVPPKHKHTKIMKDAFDTWSKASNNKVKFYYVHNPQIAQIRVNFVETMPYDEWSTSSQETMVRRGKRLRTHIYIASQEFEGKKLDKKYIYKQMLHEVGHSLGLPHTKNKLSVMYPTTNISQSIQASDINRLNTLYGFKTR